MKYINQKIQTIPYVVDYIKQTTEPDKSPFELLSQAPWYIRLISRGNYCVYKDVIYVPSFHLELIKSEYIEDRTLATAKLLPSLMLLHDYKNISLLKMLQGLYSLKYQLHYFLYEFLFLKATQNKFYELVVMGFLTSRYNGIFKLKPEIVEKHLRTILEVSAPPQV